VVVGLPSRRPDTGAAGRSQRPGAAHLPDGQKVGRGAQADPAESPNADIVNEFLNVKDGRTWQSVPVAVFYTSQFVYLHHYIECPAIYHKERLANAMRAARPGETQDRAWERFIPEWAALQQSPFYPLWACATIDEILSALHERHVTGRGPGE
jgi:hypothetical protein